MSRRTLLVVSTVISLGVHGSIVASAPYLYLLKNLASPESLNRQFHVRVLDETKTKLVTQPGSTQNGNGSGKGGDGRGDRPLTLTDLLNRVTEHLEPAESTMKTEVPIPDLAKRLSEDSAESSSDSAQNESVNQSFDDKILEISQDVARRDINITRRLVAPSSDRILAKNETPALKEGGQSMMDEVLLINQGTAKAGTGGPGLGGGSTGLPGAPSDGAAASNTPPREDGVMDVLDPKQKVKGLPELPAERIIARAPVVADIKRANPREALDSVVNLDLETYVPAGEREGFFRLQIVPKKGETLETLPKDVTFIIDASTSITQRKLDETIKGVRQTIATLRNDDRFNVVIFRDTPTLFRPSLTDATKEEKTAAFDFLNGVIARGETDVYKGILSVISDQPRPGVPGIVLVMSDGRPTTGVRDGRTIINSLTDENKLGQTIYAYGGGHTVNQYLLDLLAYRNKGESKVSPQIESISKDLPQFFSQLSDPLLVNCTAHFGGLDSTGIFPKQIPDFYKGQVVTIYGKFNPGKDRLFAMRLTGDAGPSKKEVVFQADLNEAAHGDQEIARNWAFRRIYFLIGETTRVGETPELLAEIRLLAKQYNIRTSYDE